MLHHANNAFYNVIDVGEVALAVAIVENLDGLALAQLVGEAKVGHVGPPRRAIDCEKAQPRAGDVVKLGVGMGHELIALLGGGVEGDGVIHLVLGGIGHFLVAAVDGGRRCVHQMLHRIMATGFEDVVEADEVRFDIGVRVGDGVAHAGLCGEIDHDLRLVLLEGFVNERLVRQTALDEGEVQIGSQFAQAVFLQSDVVVIIYAVQADDLCIRNIPQQALGQVRADKAGCAGDEDRLLVHFHILLEHTLLLFWR